MGWPILIGEYYSLTLIGVVLGFLYPTYTAFFSKVSRIGKTPNEARSFSAIAVASIISAVRFGFYAFIVLTIFAMLCGIGFTIWAIFHDVNT